MAVRNAPAASLLYLALASGTVGAATVTQIPVTEVQSAAQQRGGFSQSAQSELLILVQQLQEEVRQLRGLVETQQHRIERMERDQRDRYRDIDRRVSALIQSAAQGVPPAGGSVAAPDDQGIEARVDGVTPPSSAQSGNSTANPEISVADGDLQAEQDAYQQAFQLVRERKFAESKAAFETFIKNYPASRNTANAYYWIGEIDLAQQSLESARSSFKRVIEQFPQHPKVPDALYKLGVVEDRLGNGAAAQQAFERLIQLYPQSSAAGLARNYSSR